MDEAEKNAMREALAEEMTAGLEAALDGNAELSALLEERKAIEKEREGIEKGVEALTQELSRVNGELAEKKRSLCFNPLKVVKVNREIAELENLAATTRDSLKRMSDLLNATDSDLATRRQRILQSICGEHSRVETEFSAKYKAMAENLFNHALAVCEAYAEATDKARGRYGIKTNEVHGFPSFRLLTMGHCHSALRHLSTHTRCGHRGY